MLFFKGFSSKSSNAKNSASKTTDTSSLPSSRQPPATNVSRPPLPPLSSFENHASSSSSASSSPEKLQPKRLKGAKISHRNGDDHFSQSSSSSSDFSVSHGMNPQPRSPPRTGKTTSSDMYIHNDLQSYSFGAAHLSSSSSLHISIDPLSRSRDDADSEEQSFAPDTTPRPSVVDSQHPHTNHPQHLHTSQPPFSLRASDFTRDSDAASTRTFGDSSASASVSSFSRPSATNSRATSRVSGRSSTTPQTSAHDLTSDEDEDGIGRHPLPPEPVETRPSQHQDTHPDGESMYLSEDESDGYAEEYDNDIEVESVVHERASEAGTFFDYGNPSRESVSADHNGRRGSLAVPIPGATPYNSNLARDYEYSVISARRPSRSLENLHSFSFEQSSSSHRSDDPGAPTSVPESEGDWRDIRKRSIQMQRDKDLPPIVTVNSSTTAVASAPDPSATAGFDSSWLQEYKVNGVVGFDPSEMADIVGENGRLNGHRPSFYAGRKNSIASTRRQSTVSSQIDIMHRNINGIWSNSKSHERLQMWKFILEKEKTTEDPYSRRPGGPDKEKGRPSISTIFNNRPSSSIEQNSLMGLSSNSDKIDGKGKSKEKTHKEQWRGMGLDSEEFWQNAFVGRFRVSRKNAASLEPGKPPQQRLNIAYIRNPKFTNATNRETADGPSVTIHKHSKAAAFSIGRHYRVKPPPSTAGPSRQTTSAGVSSKESMDGRKKGNMILLGTRKVQKAYTSTNTTRKLEEHGLLNDGDHGSSKDAERSRRAERERRAKHRDKDRKDKKEHGDKSDKGKAAESSSKRSNSKLDSKPSRSKEKEKGKEKENLPNGASAVESSEDSSIGSVAMSSGDSGTLTNSITAVTTPDPSYAGSGSSAGGSSVGSVDQSIFSHETTSSDRTARAPDSRTSVVQHRAHSRAPRVLGMEDDGDEEYDSSDERPRISMRTSHREAYAALPPEAFDSAHQESTSRGLFGFAKSITGDRSSHRANPYMERAYNPPWPTTHPRHNSETRKYIVDDLNTSFQDVGLLPTTGEMRPSSSRGGQPKRRRDQPPSKKPTKRSTDATEIDIFEDVPDDALYMLLPLWPGETDSVSARKYPYTPQTNHINSRQYLLLYFKTYPAPPNILQEESSKTKPSEKKKKGSQDSPASSTDADKNVLLHNFHASARVFSHRDLQGSGVRIPDVGLAVSGPLKDAYENLPDKCQRTEDIVLATCHSRNMGIEFWPEGFDKIGLTRPMLNPRPLEPHEDDDSSSAEIQAGLTPLGRAVLEMAWLGCLAVTSFNPNLNF